MKYIPLFEQAKKLSPISLAEWDEFIVPFVEESHPKGKLLVRPGQPPNDVFIVLSGILRNYDLDQKGKEYTKVFRGPGGLLGSYSEILGRVQTRFYIETVTASQVIKFPFPHFQMMMQKYRNWETLGRRFAELNYLEKEKREYELMHFSAEERYNSFLNHYGELALQIPQFQIASVLGISPEALNRLIKKIKNL
jgi:CRP-like cAMP-binding protein